MFLPVKKWRRYRGSVSASGRSDHQHVISPRGLSWRVISNCLSHTYTHTPVTVDYPWYPGAGRRPHLLPLPLQRDEEAPWLQSLTSASASFIPQCLWWNFGGDRATRWQTKWPDNGGVGKMCTAMVCNKFGLVLSNTMISKKLHYTLFSKDTAWTC